jgi:hypothetical protein
VDSVGDFLFVASDRVRSIRLVQDRHLESILAADFVWLVAPDGYVGQSASIEIGFAMANDVPVFCLDRPSDLTLRQYVRPIISVREAVRFARSTRRAKSENFLIDPHAAIEKAHEQLEQIDACVGRIRNSSPFVAEDGYAQCSDVVNLLRTPGRRSVFGS